MNKCSQCNRTRDKSEFDTKPNGDIYKSCKTCIQWTREHDAKHRDRNNEWARQQRQQYKEEINEQERHIYQKNREHIRQHKKENIQCEICGATVAR